MTNTATAPGLSPRQLAQILDTPFEEPEEVVRKEATISFDGRQFLARIPSEVSQLLKIKKGDKLVFNIQLPPPHTKEEVKTTLTLKQK